MVFVFLSCLSVMFLMCVVWLWLSVLSVVVSLLIVEWLGCSCSRLMVRSMYNVLSVVEFYCS